MDVKIKIENASITLGSKQVLKQVTLDVYEHMITGLMGPAGGGKSTLISMINRMIDFVEDKVIEGAIMIDGRDILEETVDVVTLRRKIGTVFAVPLPIPRSIFENVAFGPRLKGVSDRITLHEIVEESLTKAFLWDEVKDRLTSSALKLSGGQQQRLCLARTLAVRPDIILLDEPCSGLDPISTAKIEEALNELKQEYTIILVSNNTKQIARATDFVAFLYMGELIEVGITEQIFTKSSKKKTEDYILGKFG